METKNKIKKAENQKVEEQKPLSEKEIMLRKRFAALAELLKKHNVKPFDRKQIYGTY